MMPRRREDNFRRSVSVCQERGATSARSHNPPHAKVVVLPAPLADKTSDASAGEPIVRFLQLALTELFT